MNFGGQIMSKYTRGVSLVEVSKGGRHCSGRAERCSGGTVGFPFALASRCNRVSHTEQNKVSILEDTSIKLHTSLKEDSSCDLISLLSTSPNIHPWEIS